MYASAALFDCGRLGSCLVVNLCTRQMGKPRSKWITSSMYRAEGSADANKLSGHYEPNSFDRQSLQNWHSRRKPPQTLFWFNENVCLTNLRIDFIELNYFIFGTLFWHTKGRKSPEDSYAQAPARCASESRWSQITLAITTSSSWRHPVWYSKCMLILSLVRWLRGLWGGVARFGHSLYESPMISTFFKST